MSKLTNEEEEELVKQWTEVFNTEVLQYATPTEASDEEVFGDIYHSLAHSPLAATMIQLEHSHANAIGDSDSPEAQLETSPEDDWERVCRVSNASHVRETQRREFRQWIQTVHEDSSQGEAETMPSIGTMSRSDSAFTMSSMALNGRSESFTITLGNLAYYFKFLLFVLYLSIFLHFRCSDESHAQFEISCIRYFHRYL